MALTVEELTTAYLAALNDRATAFDALNRAERWAVPVVALLALDVGVMTTAIVRVRPQNGVPAMPFRLSNLPYLTCEASDMIAYLAWWKGSAQKQRLDALVGAVPDCCNWYAKTFWGTSQLSGLSAVGMVIDQAGGHAYNVWVDRFGKAYLVEPQYGTFVGEAPEGGELGQIGDGAFYQVGKPGTFVMA